jgi:hypothetical protein
MTTITYLLSLALALSTLSSALPAIPKLNSRAQRLYDLSRRQSADAAPSSNLTDVDILQLYTLLSPPILTPPNRDKVP